MFFICDQKEFDKIFVMTSQYLQHFQSILAEVKISSSKIKSFFKIDS